MSLRLTDLIQMVCLARSDLVVKVISRSGRGTINIRQGQIHHAETDHLLGESAFFEVLRWDDGQFEVLPAEDMAGDSINKPWEHLLLEAIRRQDEALACPGQIEPPTGELEGLDFGSLFDDIDCNLLPPGGFEPAKQVGQASLDPARRITRVLIVDDSAFFAKKLREMLEKDPAIRVAAIARNGREMLEILESGTAVDIITLDIEMPVMPGETSIKHLMIGYRLPVLIVSSIQQHSMEKLFNFFQLGAVDFVAKPGPHEDHESYASKLCELVKGASTARLSNFRRLRRLAGPERASAIETGPAGGGDRQMFFQSREPAAGSSVMVVVGAEGAHTDWFRLPLKAMCRKGLVLGLQKLTDDFLPAFARRIEKAAGIKTESSTSRIFRDGIYLGNARREADFRLSPDRSSLEMNISGPEMPEWKTGMESWLIRLAEQVGESLRICFLSGIDSLSDETVNRLIARHARLILFPRESVICSGLIDGIHPYAHLFPDQVTFSGPDTLAEFL